MTCALGSRCTAPACIGRAWAAKGASPQNQAAYIREVAAYMDMSGETSPKRASQKLFKAALRDAADRCVLR